MKRSLITRLLDFILCVPSDELILLQMVSDRLGKLLCDNKKSAI